MRRFRIQIRVDVVLSEAEIWPEEGTVPEHPTVDDARRVICGSDDFPGSVFVHDLERWGLLPRVNDVGITDVTAEHAAMRARIAALEANKP